MNDALAAAGVGDEVIASASGGRIVLSRASIDPGASLAIAADAFGLAATELGLATDDSASVTGPLGGNSIFSGLTIDNPADVDYYAFSISGAMGLSPSARLTAESLSPDDGLTLALKDAAGNEVVAPVSAADGIDLTGLSPDTTYVVEVRSNQVPTIYSLEFALIDGAGFAGVDLATHPAIERRDVLLGGPGDDILSGGGNEDWIFGNEGNDVLTGGTDRGASDLLFGGPGDDTFQTVPDQLPLLTGTSGTFLPTFSDRFYGGDGRRPRAVPRRRPRPQRPAR